MKQVVDDKIQHDIVDPIFVRRLPAGGSPLARVHRSRPGYVERFELMVAGFELCNAYSEQNDAAAQLAAFEGEARAKAQGDPEAGDIDLDYVRALEYGLPCTGGLGHRHRPAGHAAVGRAEHPRGDPVPDHAARGGHRPDRPGPGRAALRRFGRAPGRRRPRRRHRRAPVAGGAVPRRDARRAQAPSSAAADCSAGFAEPRWPDHAAHPRAGAALAHRSRSARRSGRPGSASPGTW